MKEKNLVVAIPAGFEPATHGVEIRYSFRDLSTLEPERVIRMSLAPPCKQASG